MSLTALNFSLYCNFTTTLLLRRYFDFWTVVLPTKAAVEAGVPLDLNMDSIRLGKMMGGNISDCSVLRGMVVQRRSLTNVTSKTNAKIAVFNCPVEASATEAKSTVLISNADELVNYNKSEEAMMEANIKAIRWVY